VDGGQRIEVLFTQTDRTVQIDLEGDAESSDVVDLLVAALNVDDPAEAERWLTDSVEGRRRANS
jgi:hypothetical protein